MSVPLASFLTVWSILALNILSPGPNVLNTIATAMGSGRAVGMASSVAVGVGSALWCLGMSLGMAALFAVMPVAQSALTFMAAGLLIYFAVRYLRAAFLVEEREAQIRARGGDTARAAFLRSFSIVASNPKALTTWLAILGIFPVAAAGAPEVALLTFGAFAISFAIHTAYTLVFSVPFAGRLYLRAAPVINAAVGIFFVSFAIRLVAPLLASL